MGTLLIILIIIFAVLPLLRRWLTPWLQRFAARKTEDFIRRQMGMPPRDKKAERKAQNEARKAQNARRSSQGSRRHTQPSDEPIIPKEYAEDVEFVEIKEFESTEVAAESADGKQKTVYRESQVSDAEWVEIKE